MDPQCFSADALGHYYPLTVKPSVLYGKKKSLLSWSICTSADMWMIKVYCSLHNVPPMSVSKPSQKSLGLWLVSKEKAQ